MGPTACHWCQVVADPPSVLFAEPMFVVLAPGVGSDGHLTLVPTLHVATLAEMPSEDMASFLAGLSKLIRWLEETKTADVVEIRVGPHPGLGDHDDHHFHLDLRTRERA